MVWHSLYPDGNKSVKQNTTPGQDNTTYIESTMNEDHFWNKGDNNSGHHLAVNMKNYADTAIGAPTDPTPAIGFDGVYYVKQVNGRNAGFYRNSDGIFQAVAGFISGSANITSSYQDIVALPDACYGNIWFFKNDSSEATAFGSFKVAGGVCQAYCTGIFVGNSATQTLPLRFGNGDQVSGLNLRVRTSDGPSGIYQYRIQFWAI